MKTKTSVIVILVLIAAAIILVFAKKSGTLSRSLGKTESPTIPAPVAPLAPVPSRQPSDLSVASKKEQTISASSQEIIAKIKEGLAHSGSRHTYATFSKLSEMVDATNVREVLAFVQALPKPQEKSMLVSLFVARWAELEPAAAIAYAEALPGGSMRNWAVTSAVSGWAESDPAAATSWVQQLPIGPLRDQAMQTVVSALADKDPLAALSFLENLPPGRNRTPGPC